MLYIPSFSKCTAWFLKSRRCASMLTSASRSQQYERTIHLTTGWLLLCMILEQVELRINAHFSREPTLVEAFQKGQDVHATSAMRLFGKKSLEE
eukprot:scaffold61541_cov19-Tisochrysis_lutea.AAC.1